MQAVSVRCFRTVALGALGVSLLGMVGCSSSEKTAHGYYPDRDITPVATSSLGGTDAVDRMVTFTNNTNLRRAHDDVQRFLLLDKPTGLSPKHGTWF